MPYKIVKTYEKGKSRLSAIPSTWEEAGVLRWPKFCENKLRKIENSQPESNWKKLNCKVKRSGIANFRMAEDEIVRMCQKSETETDAEQEQVNKYLVDPKDIDMTFEEIVQDCISPEELANSVGIVERQENGVLSQSMDTIQVDIHTPAANTVSNAQQNVSQHDNARNVENALILLQSPAPEYSDFNAQQNETTEVQIDNASLTLMVLEKIETMQENYKTLNEKLSENIKAQQEDRKFINETLQSILRGISNITVQFEQVMNQFNQAENKKQKETIINTIKNENDLKNFEKELENPEAELECKKKFSIVCGKGKGRGMNNAYALVDLMFSRSFLHQCSWAGGSRTAEQKVCFKSHSKMINFFFDTIHESDSSFTLLDCHTFFKNILKNSGQRNKSKQERTSTTKNRPKIKAYRKNLCSGKQTSLPITGTSAPENRSNVSSPVTGMSASSPENNDQIVSESVAEKQGKPYETSV